LRALRQGEIDLVVAFVQSDPRIEAYDRWTEHVVWVRGRSAVYDPALPVPLAAHEESCLLTRLSIQALDQAGRDWDMVFTGASSVSVAAAVAAGLGISATIERLVPAELAVWHDPPLPALPDIECGIYLREGHDHPLLEELAEALAAVIRPPAAAPLGSVSERQAG
jgi:DNA-binding transcriptional LysR family regulator